MLVIPEAVKVCQVVQENANLVILDQVTTIENLATLVYNANRQDVNLILPLHVSARVVLISINMSIHSVLPAKIPIVTNVNLV